MRFEKKNGLIYDNYQGKCLKQDEIVAILNDLNERALVETIYSFNENNYCIEKNGQFFSYINKRDISNIVNELNQKSYLIECLRRKDDE